MLGLDFVVGFFGVGGVFGALIGRRNGVDAGGLIAEVGGFHDM